MWPWYGLPWETLASYLFGEHAVVPRGQIDHVLPFTITKTSPPGWRIKEIETLRRSIVQGTKQLIFVWAWLKAFRYPVIWMIAAQTTRICMNEWELHMSNLWGHRLSGNLIFWIVNVIMWSSFIFRRADLQHKARFQVEGSLSLRLKYKWRLFYS